MTEKTLIKDIADTIRQGDIERFKLLIEEDRSRLNIIVSVFGTCLHRAASCGSLEIVQYLVAQGLDVNKHCESIASSFTPIQAAVSSGKVDIVRYLLDCGAKIDTSKGSIENALFVAAHQGHTEIAQLLIDRGIDAKIKYNSDTMKNTDALALAYEYGQIEMVNLLRPYSLGEPVFWHGDPTNYYLSPVIDSNYVSQGWRKFDSEGNRLGTFDSHAQKRIGD
jgi:uncharacterized protein